MNALATAAAVVGATTAFTLDSFACDPIPPPAACPGVAKSITLSASWVSDGAGGTLLEVTLTPPANRPDLKFGAPDTFLDSSSQDAGAAPTIVSQTSGPTLTARLAVDASATKAFVQTKLDCANEPKNSVTVLTVELDIGATRTAGTMVSGTVN